MIADSLTLLARGLSHLCHVCSFSDTFLEMHIHGSPHMCSQEKLSSDGRGSFVGWQPE